MANGLNIVILGLSITSSWGNGHATTYRGLVRELTRRGHSVTFLERNVPWYAQNRDLPNPPYGRTELYSDLHDLQDRFTDDVRSADAVIVGSYVPEGAAVGEWATHTARSATAFYDIDTPITLAKLEKGDEEYLSADLIPRYDLYLSFTGGPTIERIEKQYGSPMARPLYCSFDPEMYYPEPTEQTLDMGYLGTYSSDRQPQVERLLIEPARRLQEARFAVAGPQYPESIQWPSNVSRIDHLPPHKHREFYNSQRFTLNVTRADMVRAGYSPSVRLFEAAACAVPIISDWWEGLDSIFKPSEEILISHSSNNTIQYLLDISDDERRHIGRKARIRVMAEHTSAHRAAELEGYLLSVLAAGSHDLPIRRVP